MSNSEGGRPVFLFKKLFFDAVEKIKVESGGKITGMVSAHAHLDRAFTVNEENWKQSMALMEEKWKLVDEIRKKNASNPEGFKTRVRGVLDMMIENGVSVFRTHVDTDLNTGLSIVESLVQLRDEYEGKIVLQLIAHPSQGFLLDDKSGHDQAKIDVFEKACAMCDGVGGLPSADRELIGGFGLEKHLDVVFGIAKNLGKKLEVHIDQENNPLEKDSSVLIEKVREHHYEGKVGFLHLISLAAQEKSYRDRVIADLADIGASVIVCPSAALGMKQHDDKMAPLHNSIAPVPELMEAGVNVCFGFDNISDVYVPECSGEVWDEMRMLSCACRYYLPDELAKIATVNGYKWAME